MFAGSPNSLRLSKSCCADYDAVFHAPMVFLKHGNIMPLPVRTGTGFGFVNWPARGPATLPSDSGNGVNYIIFLIPVHPSSCYAWGSDKTHNIP